MPPAPEVKQFFKKHTSLVYNEANNKVICTLTKHEMPAIVSVLETYLRGKKYRKAVEKSFSYDKYKPHIVPSTKKKHQHELFCFLTLRHVARTPEAVERHVNGKRYKRAFLRWTKCQESGEKYIARATGQRSKSGKDDQEHWSEDSVDEGKSDDDLEDLYPPEHFGASDESEDDSETQNSEDGENHEAELNNNSKATTVAGKNVAADDSDYDMDVLNDDQNSPTKLVPKEETGKIKKKIQKVEKSHKNSKKLSGKKSNEREGKVCHNGMKRKDLEDTEKTVPKKKKKKVS